MVKKRGKLQSDKLIVALDVASERQAQRLVNKLSKIVRTFKVGNQLYSAVGPRAIEMIRRKRCKVFLDFKLYDIPSAVARAAEAMILQGISIFTVHASGGLEMMREAVKTTDRIAKRLKIERPMILGVTVLTSVTEQELREMGIKRFVKDQALYLAQLAKRAGLDGVIASAEEVKRIKEVCGKDFIVVTPGIRPTGAAPLDQRRTMTPKAAIAEGADYIVVGRPIIEARDPLKAAKEIIAEIENS